MWFLIFLFTVTLNSATEVPTQYVYKQYRCCPQKFGYYWDSESDQRVGRHVVRLSTPAIVADSDGAHDSVTIPCPLFKRILCEIAKEHNYPLWENGFAPEAAKSSKALIARFVNNNQSGIVVITHKDLMAHVLPHLRIQLDSPREWTPSFSTTLRGLKGGLQFNSCIHAVTQLEFLIHPINNQLLYATVETEFTTIVKNIYDAKLP